ncbi:MAG: PEP-CTERM sorting domain-containing protein [Verrucomicrobiota bacterium]
MNKPATLRFAPVFLSAALTLCSGSQASDVGMTINSGTGFAFWDAFPGANFSNDAPDTSAGLTSPVLGLASGGLLTGSGSRIYDFGSAAAWTAAGSASFGITGFELQVKNYQYSTESLTSLFAPTLNGLAFDSVNVNFVTEGANTQEIVTWSWSGSLASSPSNAFSVALSEPGAHISIDALAIRAIPEPSASFLLLGGTAVLAAGRRRRRN